MISYIIRRLLWAVVLLLVVSFITFLMFVVLPSADPALLRAGRNPSPEVVQAIRKNLGLDKPWYMQYAIYVKNLALHFDFGYSYQNNVAVRTTVFDRLPATASLAIGGAVVWLLTGITVGIVSAIKRGTILDRLAMGGALLAISAPAYWLGLVSIYLFSKDLGKLLPIFPAPVSTPRSPPIPSSGRPRWSCRGSCSRRRSRPSMRGFCAPTCSRSWARTTCGRRVRRGSASAP